MKVDEVVRIANCAADRIADAIKADGRPGKTGGYLCVADKTGIVFVCQVGEVFDQDAANRYIFNCKEKALRIVGNPSHVSSWQSRDVEAADKKYGGGINTPSGIAIAFSGFTEKVDEAFSALVAQGSMFLENQQWWCDIRELSQNQHMMVYGEINIVAAIA